MLRGLSVLKALEALKMLRGLSLLRLERLKSIEESSLKNIQMNIQVVFASFLMFTSDEIDLNLNSLQINFCLILTTVLLTSSPSVITTKGTFFAIKTVTGELY